MFSTWVWVQFARGIANGDTELCDYKTYCVISLIPEGKQSESESPSQVYGGDFLSTKFNYFYS